MDKLGPAAAWPLGLAGMAAKFLFCDIFGEEPRYECLREVAKQYGHWSFEHSSHIYEDAAAVVEHTLAWVRAAFEASPHYSDRFDRVQQSPTMEPADTRVVIAVDGKPRTFTSPRAGLYEAWWAVTHPLAPLVPDHTADDASPADIYDHLEGFWNDGAILDAATKLRRHAATVVAAL